MSSIRGFHTCQLQWWFKRQGEPEAYRPVALVEGIVLHAALAFHLKGQMAEEVPPEADVLEVIEATWFAEECGSRAPIRYGRLDQGQVLERLRKLYGHWRATAPVTASIVAVEQELRVALPGLDLPLLGYVDLVIEGDEGDLVIDFKTSASRPSIDDLHSRFDIQRLAMTRGWEQASGRPVAGWSWVNLIKTKEPQVVAVPLSVTEDQRSDDLTRLVAVVNPTLKSMAAVLDGVAVPVPTQAFNAMCDGCPYQVPCRKWGHGPAAGTS